MIFEGCFCSVWTVQMSFPASFFCREEFKWNLECCQRFAGRLQMRFEVSARKKSKRICSDLTVFTFLNSEQR